MRQIKIFVTHSPNRNTKAICHPLFVNVIAGSDFQTERVPDNMLKDNVGDNISSKNKSYCELTTQYWAWKNCTADYYGFCHYRRFFSFNENELPQDDWGVAVYPEVNETMLSELCMDEKSMRRKIEQYDFLIARGIDTQILRAKSVYDHYKEAPQLHIEDVDLLMKIIREKYPELFDTARHFFRAHTFYPCNMFIMKTEFFDRYSTILFDVLAEFEKRADMSHYSREGYRTPGHLGERFAGIFYEYLQKEGTRKLGELQIALVKNPQTEQEIVVNARENDVPAVLAANEKYVPILGTCLKSIADHCSSSRSYKLYIFHTDIQEESQRNLKTFLESDNFSLTFVNVSLHVGKYRLRAKEHVTTETFYRFLILDLLKMYDKVLYLDCDMIIQRDIADLYDLDLGTNLIGAALDPDFTGQCNGANPATRKYCDAVLKLKDCFTYFQAGVLLMNVAELNKSVTVRQLLEMAETGIYKYSDQDILNVVCEGRALYLDMAWNLLSDCDHYRWRHVVKFAPHYILDMYENARKKPYIIHYAGFLKPWMKLHEDFGYEFWKAARETPFYEELLYAALVPHGNTTRPQNFLHMLINRLVPLAKAVLPKGSRLRYFARHLYYRIKNKS